MNSERKFKVLSFAELYGYDKGDYIEVVSKCKVQKKPDLKIIDYQSLLCERPLSEETKKSIDAIAKMASELVKEHQFNFNNH